jgi:transcriptional regulator with XRE-family HTH domain
MPRSHDEKHAFALRLKQALKRSPKKVATPAELALQFNLRHPNEPISPQAAQKWLSGSAKPTPDKIDTLAAWLNVSAQWLRFGIAEKIQPSPPRPSSKKTATNRDAFSDDEIQLILRMRSLSAHRRYLVTEIVEQFALEQEMWHE